MDLGSTIVEISPSLVSLLTQVFGEGRWQESESKTSISLNRLSSLLARLELAGFRTELQQRPESIDTYVLDVTIHPPTSLGFGSDEKAS